MLGDHHGQYPDHTNILNSSIAEDCLIASGRKHKSRYICDKWGIFFRSLQILGLDGYTYTSLLNMYRSGGSIAVTRLVFFEMINKCVSEYVLRYCCGDHECTPL